MKLIRISFVILIAVFALASCGQNFPLQPGGWVNDFEDVFTDEEEKELNNIISSFEKTSGKEISLVTVDSVYGYPDFRSFASAIGNNWGVGKEDQKSGVVILFSRRLREVFIAPTEGAQKTLSEVKLLKIINTVFIPNCREGKYFEANKLGLQQVIELWK